MLFTREAVRNATLHRRYRRVRPRSIADLVSNRDEREAVQGRVEPIDGDSPVYLQVERQRREWHATRSPGVRWRHDTTRIAAGTFHLTDGTGTAEIDPDGLRRRHDLTVGDANGAAIPEREPSLQFEDAGHVRPEDEAAAVVYETFDTVDRAEDTTDAGVVRYRIVRINADDAVLAAGVPSFRRGVPTFGGKDDPLVLADRPLSEVRRTFVVGSL